MDITFQQAYSIIKGLIGENRIAFCNEFPDGWLFKDATKDGFPSFRPAKYVYKDGTVADYKPFSDDIVEDSTWISENGKSIMIQDRL